MYPLCAVNGIALSLGTDLQKGEMGQSVFHRGRYIPYRLYLAELPNQFVLIEIDWWSFS